MTLSHLYLDANLDVLARIGFSKADAVAYLDLPQGWNDDPVARFPIDQFLTLLEVAADQLNEPYLGLRMGHGFRISKFAQTGSIYGYCRDLKQVIEMNSLYQPLAIDAGEICYRYDGTCHYMEFKPYYADHQAYRHITDLIMGAYGTAYRWLSWASGEDLSGMSFPYEKPDNTNLYDRFFQTPVYFKTPSRSGALILSEEAMVQKLTTYDPEKLAKAQAQLDQLLGSRKAADSLDAAVEAAIRGAISSGTITTQVVAERMGRNWPDLQSELKQTDRNFRDRVDAVRKTMFAELYKGGESFAQISQALAYNDQPAFNRAFKRWYDMSPTKWSEKHAR